LDNKLLTDSETHEGDVKVSIAQDASERKIKATAKPFEFGVELFFAPSRNSSNAISVRKVRLDTSLSSTENKKDQREKYDFGNAEDLNKLNNLSATAATEEAIDTVSPAEAEAMKIKNFEKIHNIRQIAKYMGEASADEEKQEDRET
jgi:hypothetical protein